MLLKLLKNDIMQVDIGLGFFDMYELQNFGTV